PERIRTKYPQIPWKRMTAMRDKLIHEYFGVDLEKVWLAVKEELPPIKPFFLQLKDEVNKA
ncbi:MAG TPA: HepT-like ribonuclease domain-containing protein, partial [Candidatus Hypogeohydataceae bacterium YC40]